MISRSFGYRLRVPSLETLQTRRELQSKGSLPELTPALGQGWAAPMKTFPDIQTEDSGTGCSGKSE